MHDVAALYREFDPAIAITTQDSDLYVDWQRAVYPEGRDPISRIARRFRRSASPERPITLLLAGQRGVGKTTELSRLRRELMHGANGSKVFVSGLRAQKYLDLEDIHPEDLVLQLVRQLAADLSAAGMDVSGFGIVELLRSVSDLVTGSRSDAAAREHDPLAVAFTLTELPADRDEHRAIWRKQLPAVFDLVNDELLPAAREYLAHDGYEDLVLVAEELDRIPRKQLPQRGVTNHESLFLPSAAVATGESTSLLGLRCSLLLTIPPELTLGPAAKIMKEVYGGPPHFFANVPLVDRYGARRAGAEDALVEILRRRASHAGLAAPSLFHEPELLRRVVRLSGGNIRALLVILRDLLDRVDELPIGPEAVERYVASRAAGMVRALLSSHRQILRDVARGARPVEDPRFIELLLNGYILMYADGSGNPWYRLDPMLDEIPL